MVALEGGVEFAHQFDGTGVLGTDHDAVGLHEVFDGGAFLEEFGVGDDAEVEGDAAGLQFLGDAGTHLVGSTDRHRRFVDHDLVVGHVAADVAGGGDDVLQVGRAVFVGRGADGDELQHAVGDGGLDVGGEAQAAGGDVLLHHGFEARFVDRDAALVEDADLGRVEVEAEHVVADVGQAGAGDEPDVTGADDCDFHGFPIA
jgi:hypothetical protein